MATSHTHRKHTFIVNFFGAVGYAMTLMVWLLVINTIVTLALLSETLDTTTTSVFTFDSTTQIQSTVTTHETLKFLLIGLLLVISWAFFYFVAKAASHTLRHFLKLFGRKVTLTSVSTVKYFVMAAGLIGLVVLLQFISNDYVMTKMAISLTGLLSGVVGVGSIWLQKLLVERYRVAITHVL